MDVSPGSQGRILYELIELLHAANDGQAQGNGVTSAAGTWSTHRAPPASPAPPPAPPAAPPSLGAKEKNLHRLIELLYRTVEDGNGATAPQATFAAPTPAPVPPPAPPPMPASPSAGPKNRTFKELIHILYVAANNGGVPSGSATQSGLHSATPSPPPSPNRRTLEQLIDILHCAANC